MRWRHPERGLIPPTEFIPVAEQQGLIGALDDFVLDEALAQLATWRLDDGCPEELTMAVNVSARELRDRNLPARIAATLDRHGVPAESLCLEISENAMLAELEDIDGVLGALVDLGITIALDDFGTGYSTLAHAQQLRPHVLKIDRRFVANVASHPRDRDIVAAVIAMAHALDMTVVGEGVETDLQRSELVALGCDAVQGFLFAAPMPARGDRRSVDGAPAHRRRRRLGLGRGPRRVGASRARAARRSRSPDRAARSGSG